jgi:hypothetical protein
MKTNLDRTRDRPRLVCVTRPPMRSDPDPRRRTRYLDTLDQDHARIDLGSGHHLTRNASAERLHFADEIVITAIHVTEILQNRCALGG